MKVSATYIGVHKKGKHHSRLFFMVEGPVFFTGLFDNSQVGGLKMGKVYTCDLEKATAEQILNAGSILARFLGVA